MANNVRTLLTQSHQEIADMSVKGSLGFVGAVTATSINTWVGIIAGLLTCVFMAFQIEAAWRKRKAAKALEEKHKS